MFYYIIGGNNNPMQSFFIFQEKTLPKTLV